MIGAFVGVVCLTVVAVLCAVGAFSRAYPDNLLQRLGMSTMGIWCGVRMAEQLQEQSTDTVQLMLDVGLAIYAVGTALRMYRLHHAPHCRRAGDPPMPPRHLLRHARTGSRHH